MYFAVDHGLADRRPGFRRDHGAEIGAHSQEPIFKVAEQGAPNQRHLIDRRQDSTLFGILHFQLVDFFLQLSYFVEVAIVGAARCALAAQMMNVFGNIGNRPLSPL